MSYSNEKYVGLLCHLKPNRQQSILDLYDHLCQLSELEISQQIDSLIHSRDFENWFTSDNGDKFKAFTYPLVNSFVPLDRNPEADDKQTRLTFQSRQATKDGWGVALTELMINAPGVILAADKKDAALRLLLTLQVAKL